MNQLFKALLVVCLTATMSFATITAAEQECLDAARAQPGCGYLVNNVGPEYGSINIMTGSSLSQCTSNCQQSQICLGSNWDGFDTVQVVCPSFVGEYYYNACVQWCQRVFA